MQVLYITYDGIADPLGLSQIIPYLRGIASKASIHVISFEKKNISPETITSLSKELSKNMITWDRLDFSEKKNIFSKAKDFFILHMAVFKYVYSSNVDVIHARGLPPAITAAFVGLFSKTKLLFDMRGLWADERITKGSWKKHNLFDSFQYKIFKLLERFVVKRSTKIITLTKSVIAELKNIQSDISEKITIIPCAADFNIFKPESEQKKVKLKIRDDSFVLGYLGSVGPLYQFKKFLELFMILRGSNKNISALIVTNNLIEARKQIKEAKLSLTDPEVILIRANREEVPSYINYMDVLVSFCTDAYSAKGASPTKIGEALACGVPVISNQGIGDTDIILKEINGGIILPTLESKDFSNYAKKILELKSLKSKDLSYRAKNIFDLNIAIKKYLEVYEAFS